MSDYQSERDELTRDLAKARGALEVVIQRMTPEDMARARRGGWAVGRVLQHVLDSERDYARLAARLAGSEAPTFSEPARISESPAACIAALKQSRDALLGALSAANEASFYRLQQLGHQEYSLASLLENVANHDREHADQIRSITAT